MRPIDADVLKEKVLEWMPNDPCGIEEKEFPFETDIVVSLMMEIEEAPTIEPERKKGRWEIYVISPFDGEGCRCSECGTEGVPYWDYCPNCGARMVREDGEA